MLFDNIFQKQTAVAPTDLDKPFFVFFVDRVHIAPYTVRVAFPKCAIYYTTFGTGCKHIVPSFRKSGKGEGFLQNGVEINCHFASGML